MRYHSGHSYWKKAGLTALASVLAINGVPAAHSDVVVVTQTLQAQLAAVGKVSAPASLPLAPTGTVFSPFAGSLTLRYRVRSAPAGSVSTLTVQATGNFSPSGGPDISNDGLTYTCAGATLGAPCSGSQTMSLSSQTSVTAIPPAACTGGGAPCSTEDPNSVDVDVVLDNDPAYKAGSYTAAITFTISVL